MIAEVTVRKKGYGIETLYTFIRYGNLFLFIKN
jgi:hypothetical protein